MLFWEMIRRDADRLRTRVGVLGWLASHCPELWNRVVIGEGASERTVRDKAGNWSFSRAALLRWQKGIDAIQSMADAKSKGKPIPAATQAVVNEFYSRHLRHRVSADGTKSEPYFIRRVHGERRPVLSAICDGRFDSPEIVIAYAVISMIDPNVVRLGGGRCPECGQDTGTTKTGKRRTERCPRCKMAAWRRANPARAKRQAWAQKRKAKSKKTKSKGG